MPRKPEMESVVVWITSLAAIGLTAAALLMPIQAPAIGSPSALSGATAAGPAAPSAPPVGAPPPSRTLASPSPQAVAPNPPAAGPTIQCRLERRLERDSSGTAGRAGKEEPHHDCIFGVPPGPVT